MLLTPLFPGIPGGIELMVVLLIVVLLFGANKVPKLARASGQALGEFKRGRQDIEDEIRTATETAAETPEAVDADADTLSEAKATN
jgi:sec-independent protein translocase protein TatA